MNNKSHAEDSRDEINKYYPSLFSAIIVVMPFISKQMLSPEEKKTSSTDSSVGGSFLVASASAVEDIKHGIQVTSGDIVDDNYVLV